MPWKSPAIFITSYFIWKISFFGLAMFFPFLWQPCRHAVTIFNRSRILHICKNVKPRVWGAESQSSFVSLSTIQRFYFLSLFPCADAVPFSVFVPLFNDSRQSLNGISWLNWACFRKGLIYLTNPKYPNLAQKIPLTYCDYFFNLTIYSRERYDLPGISPVYVRERQLNWKIFSLAGIAFLVNN